MAKLTLSDIASRYGGPTLINANNAAVEAALENTLSRDGTAPNAMLSDFDMNHFNILNCNDLTVEGTLTVGGQPVTGGTGLTSVGLTEGTGGLYVVGSPLTSNGSMTVGVNTFTDVTPGVVPLSGGGTTNFLRADGSWAPAGGGGGGGFNIDIMEVSAFPQPAWNTASFDRWSVSGGQLTGLQSYLTYGSGPPDTFTIGTTGTYMLKLVCSVAPGSSTYPNDVSASMVVVVGLGSALTAKGGHRGDLTTGNGFTQLVGYGDHIFPSLTIDEYPILTWTQEHIITTGSTVGVNDYFTITAYPKIASTSFWYTTPVALQMRVTIELIRMGDYHTGG